MDQDLVPKHDYNVVARRQTVRQLAVVLAVLVICFLATIGLTLLIDYRPVDAAFSRPVMAEIATMYFAAIMMFCQLLVALLLFGLAAGVVVVTRKVPPLFKRAGDLLVNVHGRVHQITDTAAGSVIKAHAGVAAARHFVRGVVKGVRPGRRLPPSQP